MIFFPPRLFMIFLPTTLTVLHLKFPLQEWVFSSRFVMLLSIRENCIVKVQVEYIKCMLNCRFVSETYSSTIFIA